MDEKAFTKQGKVFAEKVRHVTKCRNSSGEYELTMYIDKVPDGILITTTNSSDNTQHDIEISREDWKLIKLIMDNFSEGDN